MNTHSYEYRTVARSPEEQIRLERIRKGLIRGEKNQIAERLGVHRVWVSKVIAGDGTSERVLAEAERLIQEREKQTN